MKKLTIFEITPFLMFLWMLVFAIGFYFENKVNLSKDCLYASVFFLILGIIYILLKKWRIIKS
jgi:hypothetical protein